MLPRASVTLALSFLAVGSGCAVNPVTHRPQVMLVSEAQEKQLGQQADPDIVAQYGVIEDQRLSDYATGIGQRLVDVSHRKELAFTFRVLDDPVVNAFALPGGYVYVTRGILAYLGSEAALAGVMGHEVGHVTARHGAQRMTKQMIVGVGLGAIGLLSERLAGTLGTIGNAAATLVLLKYSRDDERQADQLGVEYATALGYDTRDMAAFFSELSRMDAQSGTRLPTWTSTHPDPGERHEKILALTAQAGRPDLVSKRDEYLSMIDGLVFGSDPRQGYVDGGRFLHPELRLQFPIPSGWQVQNSRSQVVLSPAQDDLAVVFTLAKEGSPAAAADAFGQGEGLRVVERSDVQVAGQPAVRLVSEAQAEGGALGVVSTFVALQGHVFVFHGLAPAANLAQARPTLLAPVDGFGPLTDPAALAVKPVRLRVVQAKRAGPFSQVAADWPLPPRAGLDLQGLAIMNDLELEAPVQAGQKLKVLVAQ